MRAIRSALVRAHVLDSACPVERQCAEDRPRIEAAKRAILQKLKRDCTGEVMPATK